MGHSHSQPRNEMSRKLTISVIIPTLNEADNIGQTLASIYKERTVKEVIVVDGGSTDGTPQLAIENGAKVVPSQRGRGRQLNTGWLATTGTWCLFLHGDTQLPSTYLHGMAASMEQYRVHRGKEASWGAFSTIRTEFGDTLQGRLLSAGVALRTRLFHKPYGDQAIFVKRDCLEEVGGFPEWPLLEDVELVYRLKRRFGPPAIVDGAVSTSGRRWSKLGYWRTAALNQIILAGHALGVDVNVLARLYHGTGHKRAASQGGGTKE